jgi:CheY-like chemotaxis protein
LLDLSRASRGAIELRLEPLRLQDAIANAVETSRTLMDAAGHQLTVRMPDDSVAVRGDAVRLSQVFANLLKNAAKFTEPGGRVTLTVTRDGGDATISIADSGVGIAPELLPHVFDMFVRSKDTRAQPHAGLGIGLHLVRSLVAMHGGTVRALSDGLGRGSEIIVRVPIAVELPHHGVSQMPARQVHAAGSTCSTRVVIADDNRDAADSLCLLLSLLGADVETTYDGRGALEAIRRHRADIAFLDIGMPHMDGYDVARRVRADSSLPQPTLVALTGWGHDRDRVRAREAGFDHHLIKPVDVTAVRDVLASVASASVRE